MQARIQLFRSKHRNIINLVKYITGSLIMLVVVWLIDVRHPYLKQYVPGFLLLGAETSENFLSNLSGVFLSISTFTFTTILTVVGIYNSTYSPRIIQNFIDKPIILNVLGSYIGGFFYTILSLFMLKRTAPEEDVIAGAIGILFAIISMFFFIRFVQEVLRDVKSSNIIDDIYSNAEELIKQDLEKRKESQIMSQDEIKTEKEISALNTGFLYSIDYDGILDAFGENKGELLITQQVGKYITKGQYVAKLHLQDGDWAKDELNELAKNISDQFLYNTERNDLDDYQNEISNLVEIAVRALSPGTNDPNTAINTLRRISDLIGNLSSIENRYTVTGENEHAKIFYQDSEIEDILYKTYGPIITSGKDTPSLMAALLEGLQIVHAKSCQEAKLVVKDFFGDVYEIAQDHVTYGIDERNLERIKEMFLNSDEIMEEDIVKEGEGE